MVVPGTRVPTLGEAAVKVCVRNIRDIEGLGDIPYELAKPILNKVNTAAQLRKIEKSSTYVAGHIDDLWRKFLQRDAPEWFAKNSDYVPKSSRKWFKIYREAMAEQKKRLDEGAAQLQANLDRQAAEKQKRTTTFTDQVIDTRTSKKRKLSGPSRTVQNPGSRTKILNPRDHLARSRKDAALAKAYARQASGAARGGAVIPHSMQPKQLEEHEKQRARAAASSKAPRADVSKATPAVSKPKPASTFKGTARPSSNTPAKPASARPASTTVPAASSSGSSGGASSVRRTSTNAPATTQQALPARPAPKPQSTLTRRPRDTSHIFAKKPRGT